MPAWIRLYPLAYGSLPPQYCLLDSTTYRENPCYHWLWRCERSELDSRWTHMRDQLTRARACGNGATPLWGILPASTIYNTPDKFLSKIIPVRYQLRIEINPYLLTHAYTYHHIPLVVWYKYVLLPEMLYQL